MKILTKEGKTQGLYPPKQNEQGNINWMRGHSFLSFFTSFLCYLKKVFFLLKCLPMVHRSHKRVLDTLELELQMAVNLCMCAGD